jgi:hypothetical protein
MPWSCLLVERDGELGAIGEREPSFGLQLRWHDAVVELESVPVVIDIEELWR